ncbi:TetR/AcrR family transcriptional regulator [Kineococcus aurantiacus]|uniref:AcrR family transcriptional regulator n=1 Tax=Kineococcus aurantiacus TaxID=37633 RepID=A0A7Y9DLT1_9ACTN|nr:TetR/AcrR family transcriptional regulator [Kineococcus aurantiacus]NYD22920.1 AcrR family transcriptional regulator [Kineococcus aurantiacus]
MNATTKPSARDRVLASARELIQERGVHGVGMRDVVAHAGAPRGSLQHYFPGGKDQLVAEALARADTVSRRVLRTAVQDGGHPLDALHEVFEDWRATLRDSDFRKGCPFAATTVDTSADNPVLREAVHTWSASWHDDLATLLERAGLPAARTRSLATLVQSSLQGALLLARAHRSTVPLEEVEAELTPLLAALLPAR